MTAVGRVGYPAGMGMALTKRRAVDLLRVAAALCPGS